MNDCIQYCFELQAAVSFYMSNLLSLVTSYHQGSFTSTIRVFIVALAIFFVVFPDGKLRVKEGMLEGFACCDSLVWIFLQESLQKVQTSLMQLSILKGIEAQGRCSVLNENLVVLFAQKRRFFQQQHMKDYTKAEKITCLCISCILVSQIQYFWSNIAWGSTHNKDVLLCIYVFRKSEISNNALTGLLISNEYIFWLDIPMHNILSMHGFKSFQYRLHDYFYLKQGKSLFFHHSFRKESSIYQLNDYVY